MVIAHGLYRLKTNVKNPRPDRRKTRDWREAVEWKEGLQLSLAGRFDADHLIELASLRDYSSRCLVVMSDGRPAGHQHDYDKFMALWPHLEREEPRDADDLLLYLDRIAHVAVSRHSATEVLDMLIKQGKLTLADIEAAARAYGQGDGE